MAEFFERMDRDYDGKLSFEEFMGEETPSERLFRSMDKDGDGSVTKEVGILKSIIVLRLHQIDFESLSRPNQIQLMYNKQLRQSFLG